MSRPCTVRPALVIAHPGCGSGGARSDGGRTSHDSRADLRGWQSNWPTGGGTVVDVVEVVELVVVEVVEVDVVDVDVDVLDEDDVAGLVVVVLLVVVGAMVVVVTGLVRAVVDATVLVAAGGSVVRDGAPLDPSHPIATTPNAMAASVASPLTGPRSTASP
jgi:hypothetical protein